MEPILLILVFISMMLLTVALPSYLFSERNKVKQRLDLYTDSDASYDDHTESIKEEVIKVIALMGNQQFGQNYMTKKRKKLNQAYIYMRVEEFFAVSLLSSLIMFFFLYLLTSNTILSIFGLLIGYSLPNIYVNNVKDARKAKLNSQLPEALAILSNGLRAGFSFTQSLTVAAKQLESPIKDEFSKIVRDNALGMTMEKSLEDFALRTDDDDIEMLVTALIIQRKVGGNLTEILDTIADTIRDRVRIKGEIKTLTAQGRISAIIISLLPIAVGLFLFIANPKYILDLFKSTLGLVLVFGAILLQMIGIYLILKIADLDI